MVVGFVKLREHVRSCVNCIVKNVSILVVYIHMCVVYREGHFDATKLLLNHGVECNMPSGSNDDTPLTLACWKGHSDIVSLLIDQGSDLNHQTKTGCTRLMETTRWKYLYSLCVHVCVCVCVCLLGY